LVRPDTGNSSSKRGRPHLQRSKLITFFCLATWFAAPAWAGPEPDVASLARAVDQHYNQLRSLQAEFTETFRGSGVDRTESGTLWLKKPGKMRWEYRSPREKLFLSDGRSVWLYVKDDRQVRKTSAKQLDDVRSPLAFLLGKLKLEKELQGLSVAADQTPVTAGDTVLRGVPRNMADRVSGVLVEVTPQQQIARIVIEEPDGAATEFRFDQQHENVDVQEARFRFEQPAGVEVIEGGFTP
jgi:outer membrane lipoprotein carrier protein